MDKEDKRVCFHKKEAHRMQVKKERTLHEEKNSELMAQLHFKCFSDLIDFMQEKYDLMTGKNESAIPKVNKYILMEIQRFRDEWTQLHKDQMFKYCESIDLPIDEKIYQRILNKRQNYSKGDKGVYKAERGTIVYFTVWDSEHRGYRSQVNNKYFAAGEGIEDLKFQVELKRFKKNVLEFGSRFEQIKKQAYQTNGI